MVRERERELVYLTVEALCNEEVQPSHVYLCFVCFSLCFDLKQDAEYVRPSDVLLMTSWKLRHDQ